VRARKYATSLVLGQGAKASNILGNTSSLLGPPLLSQRLVPLWRSSQELRCLRAAMVAVELMCELASGSPKESVLRTRVTTLAVGWIHSLSLCL